MHPAFLKILADMQAQRKAFDLTSDDLGDKLCKAFTDGVQATIAAQQTPQGDPWPALSDAYAAWKGRAEPGQPMAHLYDRMADPDEVAGEAVATRERATATYGTNEVTREEAVWFQEGNPATGQPPRPFWGLTPASEAAIVAILDDRFATIR